MVRMIHCAYLKREAPALEHAPWPGELGERILNSISTEGWNCWIRHQTMLINENRLNLINPDARIFLVQEMEKFLFGEGSEKPQGYIPPESETKD